MKDYLHKKTWLKALLLGFITAFRLFIPFLVLDKGFFTYAGDYNSQQIPFYMYMNRMVKSGSLNWGWAIDLGSSVVSGFSFYLLGSPFFWLSCLFPYKRIPYIMPWLLMLKFSVGNLGAFLYLKRYAKDDNYRMIGAVLYTFSGFSVYNIFFNHFIESVVFFPWLMWALDEFVYNKRKGIFPMFVALNLVNNYFFFTGQVVFLFIYFFVKVYTKEYRINKKTFFNLAFESLLGCFMGIILLVPSAMSVLENPRVANNLSEMGLWLYDSVQQYFAIAYSALMPPDPPYIPALFTDANVRWSSMSAFMAMGGLYGFFVFRKHNNNSAFYKIFLICIVCAFVPVLNSMFYAFNSGYYARWFYMPLLMLAAMNMQSFAMNKKQIFSGLKTVGILTACLLVFYFTPLKQPVGPKTSIVAEQGVYGAGILIALLSLYVTYCIVYNFKDKPGYTGHLMTGVLSVTMLFGITHISLTKMPQYTADKLYKPQNYDILDSDTPLLPEDSANRRIDTFSCYRNMGFFTGIPCIQSFNSTVTPSIMEFYPAMGVRRDVFSYPEHRNYPLRSLLGVKYVLVPEWEEDRFLKETNCPGYEKIIESYPYTVYKNNNFAGMAFTYDNYITFDRLEDVTTVNRSYLLIRALAVDKSVLDSFNIDLQPLEDWQLYDYSYASFENDVRNRKSARCSRFEMTKDGFECEITLDKANLVFIPIPYDKGFTATVNGENRQIIKVNYGLCAVYAPRGNNEIIFTYRTPGLTAGIMLTSAGWLVWAGYVYILKKEKEKI